MVSITVIDDIEVVLVVLVYSLLLKLLFGSVSPKGLSFLYIFSSEFTIVFYSIACTPSLLFSVVYFDVSLLLVVFVYTFVSALVS